MHVYKVRLVSTNKSTGGGAKAYGLSVPRELGEVLRGRSFVFSVDEDGLHYRPVENEPAPVVPSWMRNGGADA